MAWTLMKEGGEAENFGRAHKEFMIDSISDIDTEPTQYGTVAPGSFAYTAGYDTIFQKSANGEWIEASEGGEGPSTIAWSNVTGKPFTSDSEGNVTAAGNMTIHYDGEEIDVGEAITSGGGGGSEITFELTSAQLMSFVTTNKFVLDEDQLAEIDANNPPAKMTFHGQLGSNEMTVSLDFLSHENTEFSISLSYGRIGGQGNYNHVIRTFTCEIEISDGVAVEGWVEFSLVMKEPDSAGTAGQVLTNDGLGRYSWEDGGNYVIHLTRNYEPDSDTGSCDKTFAEIEAAYNAGKNIVAIWDPSNMGMAERFGYPISHVKNTCFNFMTCSGYNKQYLEWQITASYVHVREINFVLET